MTHTGTYLQSLSPLPQEQAKMPCVVLAHNELLILPEFLRHYREIGVDRFLIVDDHSTDGSLEFLRDQPDVTVFAPVEGSTFRKDKRFWRAELLDTYCSDKWVVVPDADEHLVYKGIDEGLDLFAFARNLEDEGAQALHAVMLDMYCDMPLKDHRFLGGSLIEQFPLFDGPDHYFRIAAPARFRKKYPTPFAFALGGMRQRLFEPLLFNRFDPVLLNLACKISGNFAPAGFSKIFASIARSLLRHALKSAKIYNCSKIPFLKWEKGLYFYSGAHAVSRKLSLSKQNSVILHFKFTSGVEGLKYNADRGQHTDAGGFYGRIIGQKSVLDMSPVFEGTQRYKRADSLVGFFE
jgi:hypothetical protein